LQQGAEMQARIDELQRRLAKATVVSPRRSTQSGSAPARKSSGSSPSRRSHKQPRRRAAAKPARKTRKRTRNPGHPQRSKDRKHCGPHVQGWPARSA
jgi:hypothetical protein